MKRKSFLLVLPFVMYFITCSAQDQPYSLLWEITGNGLKSPSYIFGTIHVRDARVFNLGDSVYYAIRSSPSFAIEIDMDSIQQYLCKALGSKEPDSSTLDKLLSRKKSKKSSSADKMVDRKPDPDEEYIPENFLDLYLYRVARQEKKMMYGLEPYRNQLDRAGKKGTWSKEEELLRDLFLNDLINHYVKGDIYEIEKQLNFEMPDSSHFIKRNYDMLNSIIARAHENGIFAAMGTAHLYGKNGLIALLRNKGYHLRRMDPGGNTTPVRFQNEFDKSRWVTFTDPANRFTMNVPGEFCTNTSLDGINFNLYMDPLSNHTFMVGSGMPALNVDERTMYSTIIKNLGGKGIDTRQMVPVKIKTEDGPAVQIKLVVDDYDFEYRYLFHEGFLYFFFHGCKAGDEYLSVREEFFNSLQFHQNEKTNASTIEEKGAFEVVFPGTPIAQSINLSNEDYGPFQKLYQWVYADAAENTQYLLQYVDMNTDESFLGERELLQHMISGLVDYSLQPLQHDTARIQGYPAQRDIYQVEDKSYMGILVTMRGNRIYILLKNGIEKITIDDPFFTSFTFLPFENLEPDTVYANDHEFSILALAPPNKIVDSTYYQYDISKHEWTYFQFQSDYTSSLLSVEKVALSPYLEYTWSDSLINVFNNFYSFNEEIFTGQNGTLAGFPSYRLFVKSDCSVKTIEYFLAGKTLYAINVTEPYELDSLQNASRYINSFRFHKPPDLATGPRGASLLLKDLMSVDSFTRTKATFAIEEAKFLPEDLPLIETHLLQKWNDDTLDAGVRFELLRRYKDLDSPGKRNVLSKMASQLTKNDAYIIPLLKALVYMQTPEAHALADSVLHTNMENEKLFGYYLLQEYYDSVQLFQSHLPFFVKHIDHPRLSNSLQYLILTHIRDSAFTLAPFKQELGDLLLAGFKRDVGDFLKKKNKTDNYLEGGNIRSQLELLNAVGMFDAIHPYIPELIDKNDYGLTAICLITLMQNDQKYDQKHLVSLLNKKEEANSFVFKAFNRNVFDKIPKELYNELKIAESDLYNYSSEDYYPGKLVFREKRSVSGSEDEQYFYVFEIYYDDSQEKFLGVSGPYPLTKTSDYSNDGTRLSYQPLTANNYEELLESLLQSDEE